MSRLINADAIVIPATASDVFQNCSRCHMLSDYEVRNLIDEQPTVDAVPVIRCKDCRFSGADATCCLVCKREGMGLKPFHVYHDDFCSYAERKEE